MSIKANLYIALNSLCGTPEMVAPGDDERVSDIFEGDTKPLMQDFEKYIGLNDKVLIVGCGEGVEIEYFSDRVASVVAIDVNEKAIAVAKARTNGLENVTCQVVGESIPFGDEEFDVVFMHNVCEHIIHFEAAFSHYHRVLKKGGVLINKFAPLFYSPFGAHLDRALKLPWGHLIFGVKATVKLRNKYYPGESVAESWEDLGLNRITNDKYRMIVKRVGFIDEFFELNQDKNFVFLSSHGEKTHWSINFEDDLFLVFGKESIGLPKNIIETNAKKLYKIPLYSEHIRSLNLANAVSIVVYEGLKQLS